jgi:hypothetical protein
MSWDEGIQKGTERNAQRYECKPSSLRVKVFGVSIYPKLARQDKLPPALTWPLLHATRPRCGITWTLLDVP